MWPRRQNTTTATAATTNSAAAASVRVDEAPVPHRDEPVARYAPAHGQAAKFLEWLQGPGGLVGFVPYFELAECYREMAIESGFEPQPWAAIARELRKLIPQPKRYVGRERKRMWFVPAAVSALATVEGNPVPNRASEILTGSPRFD